MNWTEESISLFYAEYRLDPEAFVLDCFDWGHGELADHYPDTWQREALREIGREVRRRDFDGIHPVDKLLFTRASGKGIGKTAFNAWITLWLMSTRRNCRGRITANTYTQLETTTWTELRKWHKRCITADWFDATQSKFWARCAPDQWYTIPITCSPENREAFAGLHAADSCTFFLFDEASLIPDEIWETAISGMTDGEPIFIATGNPSRNTGYFHEINFGGKAHRWLRGSIDSRTARMTNQRDIAEEIAIHGIDSDYIRINVLGKPPHQSENQLISRTLVEGAAAREIEPMLEDPLVAGVDVPLKGDSYFVVRFRRGLCSSPGPYIPRPIRRPGSTLDRTAMVAILARLLEDQHPHRRIAAMSIDSQPGAAIVERLRALGHDNVHEIGFGGPSPDKHYANMRAYMWGKALLDWLGRGEIDKDDAKLHADLTAPGFHHRIGGDGALVVESKNDMRKRNQASPDDGDALALTFAMPVSADRERQPPVERMPEGMGWLR
jgi:hypothetical protein